eukprot:SAG31_NODE_21843_length_539_cov_1.272727_1_plen_114_part_10
MDLLVGPTFRLSDAEQRLALGGGRAGGSTFGSYALAPVNPLASHARIVNRVFDLILDVNKLQRLELHAAQRRASLTPVVTPVDSLAVFRRLAFAPQKLFAGPGNSTGLLQALRA